MFCVSLSVVCCALLAALLRFVVFVSLSCVVPSLRCDGCVLVVCCLWFDVCCLCSFVVRCLLFVVFCLLLDVCCCCLIFV